MKTVQKRKARPALSCRDGLCVVSWNEKVLKEKKSVNLESTSINNHSKNRNSA